MEDNKIKNISFFKKVWYSITKFEKYPDMAVEGVKSSLKYLFFITAIVSLFVAINSIIQMNKLVQNLASYIENNIPDFTYADGKIEMQIDEPIVLENIEYGGINKVILAPDAETEEQKNKVETDNTTNGTIILFYKDQIIIKNQREDGEFVRQPYTYDDFITSYTQQDIKTFNKADLVNYMRSPNMNTYYMRYSVTVLFYLIIMNLLLALIDTLQLAILGWLTACVAKIRMRFAAIYNMAIYSLTLPIILNIIYVVINYFTEFTISYFQIAYMAIAYIYLAAAIFIFQRNKKNLKK